MKTKPTSRRKFLLAASLGSAGAVAAVATLKPGEVAKETTAAAPQGDGYRMTEHIQKYYKTTEV